MEQTNSLNSKTNDRLVSILSVLLLISVFIAGFFAYKTQNLVKEITKLQPTPTPIITIVPTPTPSTSPVTLDNLKSGDTITSPFKITGTIDKNWTFESTFSIEIIDDSGKSLNTVPVSAVFENEQSQVATFTKNISFTTKAKNGFVIVHADNPSGLPQNDKSIKVPVLFFNKDSITACTMEAKICPDGSSVGRTGPKCEFTACPTTKS